MRCRLGSFVPIPGSSDFDHLHRNQAFRGPMKQALEEMLRIPLSLPATEGPGGPAPLPELLATLGPDHADRAWIEPIRDELVDQLGTWGEPRLLACEYEAGPAGFVTLAACDPTSPCEVFPGDVMYVGFAALRQGDGPVRAWPRLLREVCLNGSLVCVAEFERHEGADGIGEAVRRFMAPKAYQPAIARLRETRDERIFEPRMYMDEAMRLDEHVALAHQASVETALNLFDLEGDCSRYGLFNAVTATARDLDDWPSRLELEELAGRIAWLRRPVPQRQRGAVLSPV